MQSLGLVLQNKGSTGDPLPTVFQCFEDTKIRFRRGLLSMIAAAPGGGKSSLATYLAARMAYSEDEGVPTLYFSADGDQQTVAAGILAGLMDIALEEAERRIGEEDEEAFEVLDNLVDHIWWCFKPSPTLDDIGTDLAAYAMVMGDYPHLIVVDNLMDINEPGEEYTRYQNILTALTELARTTNAHVMILHHCVGASQNGDKPIPRSEIKHKVSEKPKLVLTLHRPEVGLMGVRVVKNANGPAHTKALFGPDLAWLPEMGYFSE